MARVKINVMEAPTQSNNGLGGGARRRPNRPLKLLVVVRPPLDRESDSGCNSHRCRAQQEIIAIVAIGHRCAQSRRGPL
jgi:hypothetical protein